MKSISGSLPVWIIVGNTLANSRRLWSVALLRLYFRFDVSAVWFSGAFHSVSAHMWRPRLPERPLHQKGSEPDQLNLDFVLCSFCFPFRSFFVSSYHFLTWYILSPLLMVHFSECSTPPRWIIPKCPVCPGVPGRSSSELWAVHEEMSPVQRLPVVQ